MYIKIRFILFITLILMGAAFAVSASHQGGDAYIGDMRIAGMSGAFTAVADDYNALFYNPAGLGTLRSRRLGTAFHYGDYVKDGVFYQEPRVKPQFFFASPGWGVSIASEYYLNHHEADDTFDVWKVNTVDLGFGLNLGMFSIGGAIHASKEEEQKSVELSSPREPDFLPDFFTKIFFGEYISVNSDNSEDSSQGESVLLRAGFLFDSGIVSVGVHHDNIFDIMAWTDEGTLPTLEGLADDLHVGVSLRNARLNRYGSRNLLRIRGAMDVKHIGSDDQRKLHLGMETGLHITETDRIVLRAGYSQKLEQLDSLLFGALSPSQADISLGVGLELLFLSIQGAVTAPTEYLWGDSEQLDFGISAAISF